MDQNVEHYPFHERGHVYTKSIKLHHHLWVKPTYKPGEVWEMFGGFKTSYEIIEKFDDTNQVLVRSLSDGKRYVFSLDKWGYATTGTPTLRVRIK